MIREINPSRCTIGITWDDAPHLTEQAKEEMRRSTPSHLLGARESGIPSLGSGAIYRVEIKEIKVEPFEIPHYWPRVFGLDVGWNRTAAIWLAWDRDTDTVYLYNEHYVSHAIPTIHGQSIKARGIWIPGLIDPASRGRSQLDGRRIIDEYRGLGLNIIEAKNTVESGLYRCQEMLYQGRCLVFGYLTHFFDEFRIYRRDESGKIVKSNDHLMDAFRYAIMGYEEHAIVRPVEREAPPRYLPGVAEVGY